MSMLGWILNNGDGERNEVREYGPQGPEEIL